MLFYSLISIILVILYFYLYVLVILIRSIIYFTRALKSDSAPPRGSAWETYIVGPTQRRKEVARRERAKSREEEKSGW
jgi:hypothetical protein